MAWHGLAVATAIVALFTGSASASANHTCMLRVGTEGPPALGSKTPISVAAGDSVYIYLYNFYVGDATLQWTVNGVRIKAKDKVVTVVEGQPHVVRVTLEASDVGTVVVQPYQPAGVLSGSCGEITPAHPLNPLTFSVSPPGPPATDAESSAAKPSADSPPWLSVLAALGSAVAYGVLRLRSHAGTSKRS